MKNMNILKQVLLIVKDLPQISRGVLVMDIPKEA